MKLSTFVGVVKWRPPFWLSRFLNFLRVRPRQVLLTLSGALLAIMFLVSAWFLWFNRAQPILIKVTTLVPELAAIEENKVYPQPLYIDFSDSAAPLSAVDKAVPSGVSISPAMKGAWTWLGDRRLQFQPETDWPAGTEFRVTFQREIFSETAQVPRNKVSFTTKPFTATIDSAEFVIDAKDPSKKFVTAALTFSHQMNPATLRKALLLESKRTTSLFKTQAGEPLLTVTLPADGRSAAVRSAPVQLPEKPDFVSLELPKGLRPSTGAGLAEAVGRQVTIPSINSFLKVTSAVAQIVAKRDGTPQQTLLLQLTTGATPQAVEDAVSAWILPTERPAKGNRKAIANYEWSSPGEVDEMVLSKARRLPLKWDVAGQPAPSLHSALISAQAGERLFVRVNPTLEARGGFRLESLYAGISEIPAWPKQVKILHEGSVLALNGERKLTLATRGVRSVTVRIGKVSPEQINHLVSQSSGNFSSPVFSNYSFGEDNVSQIAEMKREVAGTDAAQAEYLAVDMGEFVGRGKLGATHGLFFLQAAETQQSRTDVDQDYNSQSGRLQREAGRWSDRPKTNFSTTDRRFILVTDLGVLVKEGSSGDNDVFVASFSSGKPVEGATVEVLGRNGVVVATGKTDGMGRARIASVKALRFEKQPVAWIVRRGDDLSFLPFNREDRQLSTSRFDVGGLYVENEAELTAFLFSNRGIYRPGETIQLGGIVRARNWSGKLSGIPVEMSVVNSAGNEVATQRMQLPADGLVEWKYSMSETAPTGDYVAQLYLIDSENNDRGNFLGSCPLRVEEFLPDRLRLKVAVPGALAAGWLKPDALRFQADLQNLYGVPAVGHRINAEFTLVPATYSFAAYADFQFYDPQLDAPRMAQPFRDEINAVPSDEKGAAILVPSLSKFSDHVYQLNYLVRGFEKEGGRSVSAGGSVLVSALPYLMGYQADGDLEFIQAKAQRSIDWLAVDSNVKPVPVAGLSLVLVEEVFVSVLIQRPDGTYAYESQKKEQEVSRSAFEIKNGLAKWPVATSKAGDFIVRLVDAEGIKRSEVRYTVVGNANLSRSLDKNAELKIKLDKKTYAPGEEVRFSVTAPYTGAGLITIERDRVYATKWFKADSTSTTQSITLPTGIDGNAYVSVHFLRALDSREIFTSPLSSVVVPIAIARDRRTLAVSLEVPPTIQPGRDVEISYRADKPGRIILFGVDEGILQVAKYITPEPLDHFLEKRALQVETSQIIDLLLPEFSIARALAAAGGDGGQELLLARLNPFKRKSEPPVVFWSGIRAVGPKAQTFRFRVPEYFNGTLRVMAVAVNAEATGSAEKKTLSKGSYVIQPNVPVVVAPGDEFEVTASVANLVEKSGSAASVPLTCMVSEHVEILQAAPTTLVIPEGRDGVIKLRLRAKDVLGSGEVRFTAGTGNNMVSRTATFSVRPPVAFATTVRSGWFTGSTKNVAIERKLRPEFRVANASASLLPVGFARGLVRFLDDYPHLCSEQLTSRALPLVVLTEASGMGLNREEKTKAFASIIGVLQERQCSDGSFGLWRGDGGGEDFDFPSVYVMHMLLEAQECGLTVPEDMVQRGLEHLEQMAQATPKQLWQARIQTYAIYILTRHEEVTTNYIEKSRTWFENSDNKTWRNDISAVYLAASLAMLQNTTDAEKLLGNFDLKSPRKEDYYDFYSELGRNGQYLALLAKHFPARLRSVTAEDLLQVLEPITSGSYVTHSAAYAVLGLVAYADAVDPVTAPNFTIVESDAKGKSTPLVLSAGLAPAGAFSTQAKSLQFKMDAAVPRTFYQVTESGFDAAINKKTTAEGMEVFREFRNLAGKKIISAKLGEEIDVILRFRSTSREEITNIAILDLLPGAFEIDAASVRLPEATSEEESDATYHRWAVENIDVREDRLIIYGTVPRELQEFRYRVKLTNRGRFIIPPVQGEAMYDPALRARSGGGETFVVE